MTLPEKAPDKPHRLQVRLGIGALMVAVLGTAVVYALARSDGAADKGSEPAITMPTPHSIVRHGETFEITAVSPSGAIVDADDPTTITLYSFKADHQGDPLCASFDPQARLIAETSDAIRIATFDYQKTVGEAHSCAYSSMGDPADQYAAMPIHLKAPLGGRRLIDEKSGSEIGLLGGSYSPTPAYVPAGFQEDIVGYYTPAGSFMAIRQYRQSPGSRSSLEVRVRSATAWSLTGEVLVHERVAGVDATVTEEDYQRCISWSPEGGLVAEVCSLGAAFLTPAELLRIAASIPEID